MSTLDGQMPNSGQPASWVPSDAVMIALLRMSLRAETQDRLAAQRSVRLQENVTELLINSVRNLGRQQEAEILALHAELATANERADHYLEEGHHVSAELAETMTHRDDLAKEVVRLRIALNRTGIKEWLAL